MNYDLEQKIMQCWGICDDLEVIAQMLDEESPDKVQDTIRGLKDLYEFKFNKLFEAYEQS